MNDSYCNAKNNLKQERKPTQASPETVLARN